MTAATGTRNRISKISAARKITKLGQSIGAERATIIAAAAMSPTTAGRTPFSAALNPTDVFNKKAAIEMMKNQKFFEKKVKNLVKKYANKKW